MKEEKAVQVDNITYLIRGDAVRLLEQWLKDNCCGAAAVGAYDGYMREVDEVRTYFEDFPVTEEEKKQKVSPSQLPIVTTPCTCNEHGCWGTARSEGELTPKPNTERRKETMGELNILDSTGDTKVIWDPKNPDEVDAAKLQFNTLIGKGFAAFSVKKKDGEKDKKLTKFDPEAGRIILVPPMQGG